MIVICTSYVELVNFVTHLNIFLSVQSDWNSADNVELNWLSSEIPSNCPPKWHILITSNNAHKKKNTKLHKMFCRIERSSVFIRPIRTKHKRACLLLLGHTDGAATTTGRLGVLTAHAQAPVMTHTAMGADLLQTLQILAQLRVQVGRRQLRVLAVNAILLPIEEPRRDLVLARVQDDRDQFLDLHKK